MHSTLLVVNFSQFKEKLMKTLSFRLPFSIPNLKSSLLLFSILAASLGIAKVEIAKAGIAKAGITKEWKEKTEKKSLSRWTLQEWLNQKERNKLMDQWLMLHTPSPYEFALEVSQWDYKLNLNSSNSSNNNYNTLVGSFTAYATLVGLEFQHNNNASEGYRDNTSFFHMRFLGVADQASHLTLSLGQRVRNFSKDPLPQRTQFLGQVDLTLYFNHHFGFSYIHQSFYPITGDAQWGDLNGAFQKANLFIDFEALRIFGGAFMEEETQVLLGVTTKRKLQGTSIGLRLYF